MRVKNLSKVRDMLCKLRDLDVAWSSRLTLPQTPTPTRRFRLIWIATAIVAHLGDGPLWLGLALLAYLLGSAEVKESAFLSTIAILATAVVVTVMKFLLRRARPRGAASAAWSTLPNFDLYSFPSGHAARLACIVVIIGAYFPSLAPLGALLTFSVAIARVALGAHYLLDVIGGAILGVWVGQMALFLWH